MDLSVLDENWFVLRMKLILSNKLEQFNKLSDNASRIKFMFSECQSDEYHLTQFEQKHYARAKRLEDDADLLFRQKKNSEALAAYNEAIKLCPQKYQEGKELYAILLEKRSTVFFVLRKYQNGLNDIAFLKQYGHHPNPEILNSREAKALTALQKSDKSKAIEHEELNWSSENTTYPALSKKLTIEKNEVMGRYVVATDDIKTGEILAIEKPYASVITYDTTFLVCRYCAASTNQVYACPKCQEVYCSKQCMEKARIYHQYECAFLPLFDNNKSFLMPIRMITQRPLQQVLKEEAIAKNNKKIDVYKTDDYYNVSRLVQHMHVDKIASNALSENEVLVGELFIKYALIQNSNAHAISKWEIAESGNNSTVVGVALYPTLSLFNHSCDPSVRRYNINNMMIIRSIKPIKAGDVVYDCYSNTYWGTAKLERYATNILNWGFTCRCQACRENWPTVDNMQPEVLRVRCTCGTIWQTHYSSPALHCPKCKKINPILQEIKYRVEHMINKADNVFAGGHYEDAKKLYAEIIDLMFKIFAPPMRDIVKMHNRLLICCEHTANTN